MSISKTPVRRLCAECQREFVASSYRQMICSAACKKARTRNRHATPKYQAWRKEYMKRYNKSESYARGLAAQRKKALELVCAVCGRVFFSANFRFKVCSAACRAVFYAEQDHRRKDAEHPILTKTCQWCGQSYTTKRTNSVVCSSACQKARAQHKHRSNMKSWHANKRVRHVCVCCGAEFYNRGYAKTCSLECSLEQARRRNRKWQGSPIIRLPKACVVCGKLFLGEANQRTCALICSEILWQRTRDAYVGTEAFLLRRKALKESAEFKLKQRKYVREQKRRKQRERELGMVTVILRDTSTGGSAHGQQSVGRRRKARHQDRVQSG